MRVRGRGGIAHDLEMLFDQGTATGVSDRELLGRFRDRCGQDAQAAFAALVARHGPMVLRVCGAILRDTNDIEDAFQATFLVLARKARAIRATEAVGSWLYGVALRTAAHTRMDAIRRRALERRWAASRAEPPAEEDRHGLERAVFEEVSRLPEEYRAPIVLCYLEGLTHAAAARRLGWPLGTVEGRLARARALLRSRLTRRGLAPAVALLAAQDSLEAAPAAFSGALADSTTRSVLTFASGKLTADGTLPARATMIAKRVLGHMLLDAPKVLSVVMSVLITAIVVSLLMPGRQAPHAAVTQAKPKTKPAPAPPGDLRVLFLQGPQFTWDYRYLVRANGAASDIKIDGIVLRRPAGVEKGELADIELDAGRHDVYILEDLPADTLTRRQQARLAAAVREGSGLIILGGRSSFGAGGWAGTEVSRLVPVEIRPGNDWNEPERGVTLELTPEGRRSWILRPGTTDDELVRAWSELPPSLGFNRFGPSKAASMILARTTGGEPLLIALDAGKGRVLVIAGQTWTWARASDGSRSTHRDFWRRALHWAAHRKMPRE